MNTAVKETPPSTNQSVRFVIGVRILDQVKSALYNPGDLKLKVGKTVMVNTDQGLKMGVIASNKLPNFRQDSTFNRVLRLANDNDIQAENRRLQVEEKAKTLSSNKIAELKLPMNLSRVVHQPHMNKTIFFFTAEGRVDFRQLIRDLASNLRHRIEMRQVGVRDEAKVIGGYGVCGETLCCSTWLPDFTPVTIKMAKNQGLALNPSKISGVCGRLMCCLQYEHDNYKVLIKNLPRVNSQIQTPDGPGRTLKNEILEQRVVVLLEDESVMTYHLDELPKPQKSQNPQKP
ncbi:MAG: sporulation protein [Nitrospina sp.]|jgi:cell fate regulator YaaT (PSP1 superfamily)|nr:sporulation protein [Nitrospina sp.]MBT3876254.1 sporulation protein [Nitrospina sp.]MBT4047981.1 sporulation protein [Nitrospina sp.]MBT4555940.1 sporulation protein [Nitrospina sp.]MBT5348011.1 sporulation protein [Nitrospina sp.]